MTSRERLQVLVDAMDDEQVEWLLRAVESIAAPPSTPPQGDPQPLPEFVGSFDSGRGGLSQWADELLAEGFGR